MIETLEDVISPKPVETTTIGSLVKSFDLIGEEDMSRIGGKGASLVILRRIGMPVPDGFCTTTEVHDYYLVNGTLPDDLVSEIVQAKNALGGKVAIRSSANCEDGGQLSMAGVFESHYVYNDADIPKVVKSVFDQAHSDQVGQFMAVHGKSVGDIKMGLVIQELIDEPEAAGVVYTGINGDNLLVQYVEGFGAKLVGGKTAGSVLLVDRDGEIAESTGFEARPLSKSAIDKLTEYSHAIEEFFSGVPQDIEFVYKDGNVYIVQARILTTGLGVVDLQETPEECLNATKHTLRRLVTEEKRVLGTRTVVLSDANYSELLPKPTEMDIGVYMYIWGGSDGIPGAKQLGHAAMGYQVGEPGQIISYIGGRTYSSIAHYAAIYHAGFPESREEYFATLVNEYLQAIEEDPEKGAYPQMGLFLQDPTLEDLQARFGDRAEEYLQIYQGFTARMRILADDFMNQFWNREFPETTNFVNDKKMLDLNGMTNEELLAHGIEVLEHLRIKSFVNFVKAARLGFYYSQRLQDVLQKTLGLGKEDSQKMYSRLNQGLDGSLITYANTAIAEADSEEAAVVVASQLIWHYSTGEMLEIRHKPLRDVPDALLTYVRGIRKTDYKQQFERQKEARLQAEHSLLDSLPEDKRKEIEGIMRPSQVYMALRETIKHLFTMDYLLLRDALEVLGSRLGLAEGDIYFLYPRELPNLVHSPTSMKHLITSRKGSFINYESLDLPNVIRESDIDTLALREDTDEEFVEAKGKFLAEGPQVEGVIVNLDEYLDLDLANKIIEEYRVQDIPTILVATQMNLSHDPLIAQAAGLVIENAGIVAHGAQRARELGKGAIGGVKSRLLKTGIKVFFDPASRSIRKVE